MTITNSWLSAFFELFYPRLCLTCGKNLPGTQKIMCLTCTYKLPKTTYHLEKENLFTERLWGRLPIYSGTAMYHFVAGGHVQQLIHQLKYNYRKDIGLLLGELYGKVLIDSPLFNTVDMIVPVPLHPKKEHRRGYNQSWMFAKGLALGMGKIAVKDGLKRIIDSNSQTKMTRAERLENVLKAFEINKTSMLEGKHILLVDDVFTTGATLEACGQKILALEHTRLSLATIAISQ